MQKTVINKMSEEQAIDTFFYMFLVATPRHEGDNETAAM
jgi:hypothetical protein